MFLVSALSLAGIPPLSGFISKFALIEAGIADDQYAVVAVSLVVSLLTLFAMIRIWIGAFWSPPEDETPARLRRAGRPRRRPAAHGRSHRRRSSSAAWPSPSPPARSTRSASAPLDDLLDRNSYIDEVLAP